MKKLAIGIAAAALTLTMGATSIFAGCHGRKYSHNYVGSYNCVDTNSNGICDYHGADCQYGYGDDSCHGYSESHSSTCYGYSHRGGHCR